MPQLPAILITRPEPQASRLAAALRAGWGDRLEIILSPLMKTEYLTPILPDGPFTQLILTSEAGAEAACRLKNSGTRLPEHCVCVGNRTAGVASAGGFRVTAHFPTASALLAALTSRPSGPYLYLHGKDVTQPLDRMLTDAGQPACAAVVYAQHEMALSADARAKLRAKPVVVPLFSARSARLFLSAVRADDLRLVRLCALSKTVSQELPSDLAETTVIAETPDLPGMLAAIRRAILGPCP